jgi:hypothetical protein
LLAIFIRGLDDEMPKSFSVELDQVRRFRV